MVDNCRMWNSEVRGQMSEVGCRMSEVRGQRSDVRSRMSDVRCMDEAHMELSSLVPRPTSFQRGRMSDDRGQRSDDRSRMSVPIAIGIGLIDSLDVLWTEGCVYDCGTQIMDFINQKSEIENPKLNRPSSPIQRAKPSAMKNVK